MRGVECCSLTRCQEKNVKIITAFPMFSREILCKMFVKVRIKRDVRFCLRINIRVLIFFFSPVLMFMYISSVSLVLHGCEQLVQKFRSFRLKWENVG